MLFEEKKNKSLAPIIILLSIFGVLFFGGLVWYFSNPQPLIQFNGKGIGENITDAVSTFQKSAEFPGAQDATQVLVVATSTDQLEAETISHLRRNWTLIQTRFSYRPSYHDPTENAQDLWRFPSRLQFIGNGVVVIGMEDDNTTHISYFNYEKNYFTSTFTNITHLSPAQWQRMWEREGDLKYTPGAWATGVIRNGQLVSFEKLVKVSENVFISDVEREKWE